MKQMHLFPSFSHSFSWSLDSPVEEKILSLHNLFHLSILPVNFSLSLYTQVHFL